LQARLDQFRDSPLDFGGLLDFATRIHIDRKSRRAGILGGTSIGCFGSAGGDLDRDMEDDQRARKRNEDTMHEAGAEVAQLRFDVTSS
jgi:hypothetical protein